MRSTAKRGNVLLTAFVAVMASGFGADRAQAQWGMGGMGMGYGGIRVRVWRGRPAARQLPEPGRDRPDESRSGTHAE